MSSAQDAFEPEEGAALDLGWLLGAAGRQRWWIAGVTGALLVPALLVPARFDDVYEARARVAVQVRPEVMRLGAEILPADPSAGGGQNPLTREREVALSDAVLGRVVDQLPPASAQTPSPLGRALAWAQGLVARPARTLSPEQLRKARIDGVKLSLAIELGASGDMMDVLAKSNDPDRATFLANALADAVVDYSKEEQRESYSRTVTWLAAQALELRERIADNQQQLSQHVAKHGAPESRGAQPGAAPTGRAAMLDDLARAEIELQTVRARLRGLPAQLSNPDGEKEYDPELLRVQQRYETARTALEEARLTYTPTHPEVRRRESVVRAIEKELEGWGPLAPLGGVNAADQQEYRSLVQQEVGLRARVAALQRRVTELSDPGADKARAGTEYERLDRQLTLDRDMLALLMRKREEVVLGAAADYTRARVMDRAIPPLGPIGPERLRLTLLGVLLALGAGLGVAVLRELLDQTLRDPDEARRLLGAPVLAMVPLMRDSVPPERRSEGSPASLSAESYRNLRTALLFSSASQGFTTLVVTSGLAGEGKTTVSSNLAASFAQVGRSVLLIDADLRRPRVHRVFGMSGSPGLSELLRGDAQLEAIVRRPSDGRFDVLSAGQIPPNPSELLASPRFSMLLARVRAQYDLVVIDSPVMLGVSDTQMLTSQADATLLVHRPGSLARRGVREVRAALEQSGARVLGVVFNQVERGDRHFYPSYLESPYLPGWREKQASEG